MFVHWVVNEMRVKMRGCRKSMKLNLLYGFLLCLFPFFAPQFGCSFDPQGIPSGALDGSADICGDGVKGVGEECDGEDLGGETCDSLGYESGELGCTADCTFDTSLCEGVGVCGNNVREGDESCDGDDLEGETCESLGYDGGELSCSSDCSFDTSLCEGEGVCGNGIKEAGEECDGSDMGSNDCMTVAGHESGTLSCDGDCTFNIAGCYTCGDNTREAVEACDGEDFGGKTCESETGHDHGELICGAYCLAIDTSLCHTCGNGTLETGEECDGEELGDATCADQGFTGGTLGCNNEDCTFDVSGCYMCGDNVCNWENGEDANGCALDCGWMDLSTGKEHTCGIRMDGTVWCWGNNGNGQLGDGTTDNSSRPVLVSSLEDVDGVDVDVGSEHSCVLVSNGEIRCWGKGANGRLGLGDTDDRYTPETVLNPSGFDYLSVSAGKEHTCAVLEDHSVQCWGRNNRLQLGTGDGEERNVPTAIDAPDGMENISMVSAGGEHTCALDVSGVVWCWGRDDKGQLGTAGSGDSNVPLQVSTESGMTGTVDFVSAGGKHTCAVDLSDTLWCWGDKGDGRLGDNLDTDQSEPSMVVNDLLLSVSFVSAGATYTCALDTEDKSFCWGKNDAGQLGTNNNTGSTVPVAVHIDTGLMNSFLISAGETHTCAIRSNNWAFCWGKNGLGQLGIGHEVDKVYPEMVVD